MSEDVRPDPPTGYRWTDRDCHACDKGKYVKGGSELFCTECSFTPHGSINNKRSIDPWDEFHRGQKLADKRGDRVYMVGGHPSAYVGDGEYEYDFSERRFNAP